uniref:CUE domain-containing protein n=1 Tax=Parastrongyloides trichosuri TaxID=131310 RepID=A0A0N4ZNJ4_PARTI
MASRNGDQESLKKKVAKVREVVSTVSTNDIVLALHNFDLDVEKTIRALCEQDVNAVIGDWETTGGTIPGKKNRKQRRQELNLLKSSQATNASNTTTTPITASSNNTVVTSNAQQNVTLPPAVPKTQKVTTTNNTNQGKGKQGKEVNASNTGKSSVVNAKVTGSPSAASEIEAIFKQIHQALIEREKYLVSQAKSQPSQQFNLDASKLISTINSFGQISGVKNTIISSPSSSRPNSNNSLKNATSHSSLVSSVGDDSGIGQVSPISVKGKPSSVPTVAINEGGINMESDSFSVDQLAEIQRKLQETLSAQGIDISLVQSMSENTSFTARKRLPKVDNKPVGKGKAGKGIQA